MNFNESFITGLEGIRSHKMRSFLTALGIVFGVSAVIAMLSIGEGAKQEALEQIKLMGMNNILIQDFQLDTSDPAASRTNFSMGLTYADARSIEDICALVRYATPQKEFNLNVTYKNNTAVGTVVGTTQEYSDVLNFPVSKGRFITFHDVLDRTRVCVLGGGIKKDLLRYEEPVGKKIKIGDLWYTVVGVMEDRNIPGGKKGSIKTRNLNQDIYIPITASFKRLVNDPFASEIDQITAQVIETEKITEAANIIRNIINRRHNGVPDFQIIIPEALLRQSQETQRIFNIVMGAIAGISLLVGGIGIMNIMLASILERTKEIGVRRAVGATRMDILGQFIIEAILISFSGGILGIFLGYGMTLIIAFYAKWSTIVSFYMIILAFGVSVSVGLLFGILPARKAAQLDPIESLRYE
ncbi:ABC transporter permease [candidate division KSB1 bacterium]